jgi:hypothetical protein
VPVDHDLVEEKHGILKDVRIPVRPQLILHKRDRLPGTALAGLDYPLLETQDEWVVHGFSYANYLAALADNAQTEIFAKSARDGATRDAFRKMRHLLMATKGAQRGRGNLADVGRGGFRRDPGGRPQLGHPRDPEEGDFRR